MTSLGERGAVNLCGVWLGWLFIVLRKVRRGGSEFLVSFFRDILRKDIELIRNVVLALQ